MCCLARGAGRLENGFSQEVLDQFPEPPPEWARRFMLGGLQLKRPLRIALPCVGIDGCTHALSLLKVPFEAVNVFDEEEGVR